MIGAALFAATAAAGLPYPAQDVLTAFGEVCLDPAVDSLTNGYQATPTQRAQRWKRIALAKGWELVPDPAARGSLAEKKGALQTYYWARALDHDLFSGLNQPDGWISEQALLTRNVGGRPVFLSILGTETDNPELAECRLRDPLGDGVVKSPINRAAIERWLGKPVKQARGMYRGTRYTWPNGPTPRSIEYHFGFAGKPFATYGAKYDPYSLYGLTLVRSDYSLDIII